MHFLVYSEKKKKWLAKRRLCPRLSGLPPFEQCERVSGQNKHVVIHHPHPHPHHPPHRHPPLLHPHHPHTSLHPHTPHRPHTPTPYAEYERVSVRDKHVVSHLALTERNNELMSGDIKNLTTQILEILSVDDLGEIWRRVDGRWWTSKVKNCSASSLFPPAQTAPLTVHFLCSTFIIYI